MGRRHGTNSIEFLRSYPSAKVIAYRYYLFEGLEIVAPSKKFERIHILGKPVTDVQVRTKGQIGTDVLAYHPDFPVLYKWVTEDGRISGDRTLQTVHELLQPIAEASGKKILSFTDFSISLDQFGAVLFKHGAKYTKANPDSAISIEINACIGAYASHHLATATDEKREELIRIWTASLSPLLFTGITWDKYQLLLHFQNEIGRLQTHGTVVGNAAKKLHDLNSKIGKYLHTHPLSLTQRLVGQSASYISKPILISVLATVAVGIVIAYFITPTTQGNSEQLPFFGTTEPYDPNSPLASMPSNLDSANYWFELGESVSNDSLRIIYFTNAIRHRYDFWEAYFYRGLAKVILDFRDDALIDYTSSIALSPDNWEGYYNRGHLNHELGKDAEAIKDYTEAIAIKPTHALSYFNRGQTKFNLHLYAEALKDYARCIELDPSHQWAYRKKGSTELILGLYKEAISDFNHALELDRLDSKAYAERGRAKLELAYDTSKDLNATSRIRELLREAQSDMSKALEIDPSDSISVLGIAHIREFETLVSKSENPLQLAKENALRTEKEFLSAMENYKKALKRSDTLRENKLLDGPQ